MALKATPTVWTKQRVLSMMSVESVDSEGGGPEDSDQQSVSIEAVI